METIVQIGMKSEQYNLPKRSNRCLLHFDQGIARYDIVSTWVSFAKRNEASCTDLLSVTRAHGTPDKLRDPAVEWRLPSLKPCSHARTRSGLLTSHSEPARRSLASRDATSLPLMAFARTWCTLEGVDPNFIENCRVLRTSQHNITVYITQSIHQYAVRRGIGILKPTLYVWNRSQIDMLK